MSESITVARPYALAAFDEAQRLSALLAWSDMLQTLSGAIQDEQVRALIANPRVPKVEMENLMLAFGGTKLSTAQCNFIRILVENHRLILLPEIAAIFEMMRAEAEKVVDVIVTSAFDLSESQKQKIITALKVRIQREIRLDCKVDPELLGGVVVRTGDRVIDGSARTCLSELSSALV